jgi:SEC-C motif domain protein
MRSRYTAFTLGDFDYVEKTITEHAAQSFNRQDIELSMPETQWLGLDVRSTGGGEPGADSGTVTFAFRYRFRGREMTQVEKATFHRSDGVWRYHDSEINPKAPPVRVDQIGRNDACPCGSGKKYKKCCGARV